MQKNFLLLFFACFFSLLPAANREQDDTLRIKRRNGYAALEGAYQPMAMEVLGLPVEKTVYGQALALSFLRGIEVSRKKPLYIETGLSLQRLWYGYTFNESKERIVLVSLLLPVRVAYRFQVNDCLTIQPYVGVRLRGNLSGEAKIRDKYKQPFYYDLFDKEEVGDEWQRFQWGIQAGVTFSMPAWFASIGLGREVTNTVKGESKSKLPCSYIGVGVYLK